LPINLDGMCSTGPSQFSRRFSHGALMRTVPRTI
jgi:hypothetical protein